MDYFSWILVVLGTIFMIAEMVIPGGVVAPLGLGMFVVVAARYIGIVTEHSSLIMLWMISSISMMIIARIILSKVAPGEFVQESIDAKFDAYGTMVKVVETVKPGVAEGRIRYQGTLWKAISVSDEIEPGHEVKLLNYDDEISAWVVEAPTDLKIDKLEEYKK